MTHEPEVTLAAGVRAPASETAATAVVRTAAETPHRYKAVAVDEVLHRCDATCVASDHNSRSRKTGFPCGDEAVHPEPPDP